jgi:hypothetical protein
LAVVPAVADVEQRVRATALHTPLQLLILILTAVAWGKPCLHDWGWVPRKRLLVFVKTPKSVACFTSKTEVLSRHQIRCNKWLEKLTLVLNALMQP